MKTTNCEQHGEQQETFVCQHVVQGLSEGVAYGFWWAASPDNLRPDAWCTLCNELVAEAGGEWTDAVLQVAKIKLLCGSCYDNAKFMNGQTE